jgi:hypothetical protein
MTRTNQAANEMELSDEALALVVGGAAPVAGRNPDPVRSAEELRKLHEKLRLAGLQAPNR